MSQGDMVEVTDNNSIGWWQVRTLTSPSRTGYVPSNYLAKDQSVESEP